MLYYGDYTPIFGLKGLDEISGVRHHFWSLRALILYAYMRIISLLGITCEKLSTVKDTIESPLIMLSALISVHFQYLERILAKGVTEVLIIPLVSVLIISR